jgi:agmatinase
MKFLQAHCENNSRIIILGAGMENTASYRSGSSLGPAAIRRASQSIESYSAVFNADLGDLALGDGGDFLFNDECTEKILEQIAHGVEQLSRGGCRVVVLGGDHTITVGVVRGLRRTNPDLQVVVLDAHSDWRDSYNGSCFSHACTVRRLHELVDGQVWVAGTRSFFGGEDPAQYVTLEELVNKLDVHRPIYLSIDLDVLDPGFCPGVGNPEPGGLTYWEVIHLFNKLRKYKIIGMDVVELHPPYDISEVSAVTAAKLVQEGILAFWSTSK